LISFYEPITLLCVSCSSLKILMVNVHANLNCLQNLILNWCIGSFRDIKMLMRSADVSMLLTVRSLSNDLLSLMISIMGFLYLIVRKYVLLTYVNALAGGQNLLRRLNNRTNLYQRYSIGFARVVGHIPNS